MYLSYVDEHCCTKIIIISYQYCIATILQNEVTRLKSVAATPSTDDTGNSEDDRQNLIQVVRMTLVYVP
jgi:hypothetical protein